jgi:secreted trypsin-like serine protease
MHLLLLALSFQGLLGGTPTTEEPDCVAVGWVAPKTQRFHMYSSGTLVAPRLVLTTGYVARVIGEKRIGAVYLGSRIDQPGPIVRVQRVIDHPEECPVTHSRRLSLLVLERAIRPEVAIPRAFATASDIDSSAFLRVVGFGATDEFGGVGLGVKRRVDLPITVADCDRDSQARERFGCKTGEMVAGGNGQDSAIGDSGGPAYVHVGDQWLLAAITDRAVVNATRPAGDGGIYIRLDRYRDWIHEMARSVSRSAVHAPAAAAPKAAAKGLSDLTGKAARTSKLARSILQSPTYKQNLKRLAQAITARGRVAGGEATTQFPDCVAIGDSSGRFFATGTLVGPRVVITAGHAFEEGIGQILIGEDFRHPEAAVAIIKVAKAVRHPDFKVNVDEDQPHFLNDVTVLILERDVTAQEATPRAFAPEAAISGAVTVMVVGFGSTGDLTIPGAGSGPKRAVEIPLASHSCDKTVDGVADTHAFGCSSGQELVAADPLRRKDSCQGDSGGPLYVKQDGRWLLAGATSRTTKQNDSDVDPTSGMPLICGIGGIYVRVDKYQDWIRKVARDNGGIVP